MIANEQAGQGFVSLKVSFLKWKKFFELFLILIIRITSFCSCMHNKTDQHYQPKNTLHTSTDNSDLTDNMNIKVQISF